MGAETLHWSDERAEIHKVVVGPYENNVFVLRCTETGDAVLLDAANEHERLLDLCRDLGVRTVLETHGHWDHIQAVPAIRDAGYTVAVAGPTPPCSRPTTRCSRTTTSSRSGACACGTMLTPGAHARVDVLPARGLPVLFSGDTLFPGGPGNTEKDPVRFAQIIEQIDTKLSPSRPTRS
jgi:glyoxylase-like metal-dependent hydrolase (beta-lactamase superfamily II)